MKFFFENLFKNGKEEEPILEGVLETVSKEAEERCDVLEIKYETLLSIKRCGLLDLSVRYRIIDYVTTTTQDNTQTAGHQFDLLLTPVSNNELSADAKAMLHNGDEYFKDSNLSDWEIKYDIENDKSKYGWADTVNGKGVIYFMKDEFGNEAPYDFKNIMFRRWGVNGDNNSVVLYGNVDRETFHSYIDEIDYGRQEMYYTFSTLRYGNQVLDPTENKSETYTHVWVLDMTVEPFKSPFDRFEVMSDRCQDNVIKPCRLRNGCLTLNDNVMIGFISYWERNSEDSKVKMVTQSIMSNRFDYNCIGNTLCGSCENNKFGTNCQYNTLYDSSCYNTFGLYCKSNFFVGGYNNIMGNAFNDNVLKRASNNVFDSNCLGNVLIKSFANRFENSCSENKLTESNHNRFEIGCTSNSLTNSMGNVFGSYCSYNTMESECKNNTFGNDCIHNIFNEKSINNVFHPNVSYVEFGKECSYNKFMGNNSFIKIQDGVQNLIVNVHIGGVSDKERFEREIEPGVPYKQEIIINKDGEIEVI